MATIIDSAAGLGRIVNGAEILPFGGSHLRAGLGGAGRILGKESDDQVVDLHGQETAELVQPKRPVDALGWLGKLDRDITVDRNDGVASLGSGVMVVERLEVFLELEGRVKLYMTICQRLKMRIRTLLLFVFRC